MRVFLNVAACVLLGAMLAGPLFGARADWFDGSYLSLVGLGVAGLMLGRWGGYRAEDS